MTTVCFVTPLHPSRNPRLVRSAGRLVQAGHRVVVVHPSFQPEFVGLDQALAEKGGWSQLPVDCLGSPFARWRWHWLRVRHRVARRLLPVRSTSVVVNRAVGYFTPELARRAAQASADLLIAQQHPAVPATRAAAEARRRPFAIDVEDLLSDSDEPDRQVMGIVEQRHFAQAAFFYSMSEPAVERTRHLTGSKAPAFTLHNCPSLDERRKLNAPQDRPAIQLPSLYWFGQTIGPHSCAETMLQAMGQMRRPLRLVLRGNSIPEYVVALRRTASALGLADRLKIESRAHPEEMVRLAAEHAFSLGSQPSQTLFHQLAIGNKVFTGLMAGTALLLTDTTAHRALAPEIAGAALLYREDDPPGLAAMLDEVIAVPERVRTMQKAAWDYAAARFNWEAESPRLVEVVAWALGASC